MSFVPFALRSTDRKTRARLLLLAIPVAIMAFLVDAAAITRTGADTPFVGDADFFATIAKSLSTNHGYRLAKSAWPNELNTSRAPLWPALLSVTYRFIPNAPQASAARFTNAAVHGIAAGLLILLTYQLAGTVVGATISGCILALYPPAIALVVGGFSEVGFLAVLLLGIILLLEGGKTAMAGSLICGLSVLGRSNYLLLPVLTVLVLMVFARAALRKKNTPARILLLCAIFYLFPLLWMLRNYSIIGAFPLLSTQEGETLYGANNALVANDLSQWGYWVMPDDIPGEEKKHVLARTRNELQLSRYYHDKAMAFINANRMAMPRLIVGKLVRGFVPVPWVPQAASYVAFGCRFILDCAFVVALYRWRHKRQFYTMLLAAMFLAVLMTTVIYYGIFRFTFCLEPFLLPVIVASFSELRKPATIVAISR